jgi:hypothetical protein
MKRKPAKAKRSSKSSVKKVDPFVSGEWVFLDNGKEDRTIRPTTIKNLKEILQKELGDPPPLRKKKK